MKKGKPETIATSLVEQATNQPTQSPQPFTAHISELNQILKEHKALGLVYIDASELQKIEYDYGHIIYNEVLQSVAKSVHGLKGTLIRHDDILALRHPGDEVFLLFLSSKRPEYSNFLKIEHLQNMIERITHVLNAEVFKSTFPFTKKILKVDVGYSYSVYNPLLSTERLVYRLIEDAQHVASFNGDRFLMQINEILKEIIMEENISTHFQPIVDLRDGSIFAYEALSRGPKGSSMESPLMLFGVADKTNLSFELDRVCRKKAIQNSKGIGKHQKVFVNTFPSTMHDPEFRGEQLDALLRESGLSESNIVFEITERFAIENYSIFQKEQEYYTNRGFELAVDDIGTGYGSLEAIANLKPNFVKIDLSIVRNIDSSSVKQELLKAVRDIGRKINAKILAEGIETAQELEVVRSLGVEYAQGFLLARPSPDLFSPDHVFRLDRY